MIPPSYKPRRKFMELAVAEAKRAGDRGDYPIGAVITRLTGRREVVIASAGNRVKTSGSSIKHVELETLKHVSSGYGRYLLDFVLYSTHEPCAMCAGACVWSSLKTPEDQSPAVERAKPFFLVRLEVRRLDSMKTSILFGGMGSANKYPGLTHNRPTPTVDVVQ